MSSLMADTSTPKYVCIDEGWRGRNNNNNYIHLILLLFLDQNSQNLIFVKKTTYFGDKTNWYTTGWTLKFSEVFKSTKQSVFLGVIFHALGTRISSTSGYFPYSNIVQMSGQFIQKGDFDLKMENLSAYYNTVNQNLRGWLSWVHIFKLKNSNQLLTAGWKTLVALIAAGPVCLKPNTRSIQWWMLDEIIEDSNA